MTLSLSLFPIRFYPSKDSDGAVIRPLPRIKHALSDTSNLPHLVQLLLTFDPTLVERVASLLHLILEVRFEGLVQEHKSQHKFFLSSGQSSSSHALPDWLLLLCADVHGIEPAAHWTVPPYGAR